MNTSLSYLRVGALILTALLASLPAIGIMIPRALSFLPLLAGLSGLILLRFSHGTWPSLPRAYLYWMMALVSLMAISALWSVAPHETLGRALKTLPVLLGGVALAATIARLEQEHLRSVIFWLPASTLCGGVFMALNIQLGGIMYEWLGEPLLQNQGGAGQDSLNLAPLNRGVMTYVFCCLVALGCLMQGGDQARLRGLGLSLLAVLGFILYQTDSQSSQLGMIIALVMFLAFPYRSKIAWRGLGVLVAGLILAAPFLAQALYQQAAPMVADQSWFKDGYAAARFEIWDFIARRALESPLVGYGAEATRSMTFDHAQLYHHATSVLHPHNFALQVWIEFGAVGALFAASFFVALLIFVRAQGTACARLILPLLMACIAAAATSYGLWQGWWLGLFTLLAAYAQALCKLNPAAVTPAQS